MATGCLPVRSVTATSSLIARSPKPSGPALQATMLILPQRPVVVRSCRGAGAWRWRIVRACAVV